MKRKNYLKGLGVTALIIGLAIIFAAPATYAANSVSEDVAGTISDDPLEAMLDTSDTNLAAETPETSTGLKISMKTYQHTFKTKTGLIYKEISYEYPVASGASEAAKAFNNFYKNQRVKWVKAAKKNLKQAKADINRRAAEVAKNDIEQENSHYYGDSVNCDITNADENYISILQSGYEYTMGAHGMPYRISYIFDAKTGKKISAAKLLGMTTQQLNAKVQAMYLKKFDRTKNTKKFEFYQSRSEVKKILKKINFNKNMFYLKKGKIRFYTHPYAVGPYASGFIEVAENYIQKGNSLLQNASPNTSALALYVYDGKTTTRSFLFDLSAEQMVLDSLTSVNAKAADNWTPAQVTYPVYGLEISGVDGYQIQAAWSNGYWIASDGAAYRFAYDFKSLENRYGWTDKDTWPTSCVLPCARLLSQDGDIWNRKMLTPAKALSAPEGITAQLVGKTDKTLTIQISNNGTEEWCYGEYFSVQALLDGTWYETPAAPGNWGFDDIAHILPAGKSAEKNYNLAMYGNLPAGTYRLVIEGMAVEFEQKYYTIFWGYSL